MQLTDFELMDPEADPGAGLGAKSPPARRFPWLAILLAMFLIGMAYLPWGWRTFVEWRYASVTFTAEEYTASVVAPEISPRIAIVFGARVYSRERLSAMLRDRVDTAIDLYHAGKVDKLLLTGGQNGLEYDEPGAMMAHALARGVPADAIQPDYGGRRTYDSCYRAAHIFQVEQAVLITQAFHLPRALLLCDNLGLDVVGVIADRRDYAPRAIAWSEAREVPALLAALYDLVRRPLPPILGEPIPID